jgi:coenzyme F420-dependent glucose-6-phosphate dehydrogenase
MKIGFHASHEQWPPSTLLEHVKLAERAGFQDDMCSDHFAPWSKDQAQSGFAWSWLGAAMATTSLPFGTVCAPGQRYHPAVIAQAAATLAEMFPGRFWLSVGSGEALNEHIVGQAWPNKADRNRRLKECVDVMRALWRGETVSYRGFVIVDRARLYTRPVEPPRIIGAALSEETAAWMAPWVDGLITAGARTDDLRKIVTAFRSNGGNGKPLYLQAALSFEASEKESREVAHRAWRQAALKPAQLADLEMPADFDAATRDVTAEEVAAALRVSSDVKQHLDWLQSDKELGFDAVYLHYLGPEVARFLDKFGASVMPHFSV